jgi:hypothetical protein
VKAEEGTREGENGLGGVVASTAPAVLPACSLLD